MNGVSIERDDEIITADGFVIVVGPWAVFLNSWRLLGIAIKESLSLTDEERRLRTLLDDES